MKITKKKLNLLGGASTALLATLISSQAVAQTVAIDSTVTVSGVDSVAGSNQAVTKNVEADVTNAASTKTADNLTNGVVGIQTNTTGASAVGNTDTLSLSKTDVAAIGTTAAITARQANTGGDTDIAIDADTTNTLLSVTVKETTGGNYGIKDSTDAATATGNTVTQGLTLSATTLSLGTANATTDTSGTQDLDASGKAVVASLQLNTDAGVSATNSGSTIKVDGTVTTSAALYVTGNTQDATATGSTATNGMTLSGSTVGGTAVVVAQQENSADSTVSAATSASATVEADSLKSGSSAKLTDNDIQSRATGVTTANTMTVDATTVTLAAPDGDVATTISNNAGTIEAAYALLNDQQVGGDVTANTTAEGTGSAFAVAVTDNAPTGVTGGSTVQNDSNTLLARAQGANTTNTMTLSVAGTLSQGTDQVAGDIANAGAIGNVQTLTDGTDVKATVDTGSADSIATTISGVLTSSSVSSSSNRLQATAEGATATNKLTVSATTLSLAADTGTDSEAPNSVYNAGTSVATADSAFSVANVQNGGNGTISATLVDPATVATSVARAVDDSTINANGNGFDAFATSNKATNSLALSGTTVTTDAGIVSGQTSNADVLSRIGWTAPATGSPEAASSPNDAGVTIDLGNTVDGSAVSVNSNVTRGSAIANTSSNTLTSSATTLSGDGSAAQAVASGDAKLDPTGTPADIVSNATATGDYSLANWQSLGASSSSTTQIAASYGIDQADVATDPEAPLVLEDAALTNSRLSVSNNIQFGEALGNSATNRISLSATGAGTGTGIDPTAALSNVQDGDIADVQADSRMNVFANAEAENSSVALNGNSNTSLGVINNASNTLAVSAVTLDGSNTRSLIETGTDTVTADYAMLNLQSAGGDLDSTATTVLFNTDYADTAGALGTEDSRVAINSNTTTAEASANRVANVMQFSAVDNGATAALGNSQVSAAEVDATATTTASFGIKTTGETNVAVSGSAINMDGNTTTALARGNSASNVMTYSVGATYSGATGAAITGTASAAATAVVLNDQSNSGGVDALAQNAVYAIALNDTGASGAVGTAASGSAFSNSNNAVNALAYGNSAVNSLTMSTFGAGLPSSAVSSVQTNTGVVTATATGVQFSMSTVGATTGSVMRSTGNSVTAQAVGNSSVSTIGGGGI